jgi:nucleoid DNA-binding protein
MRKFGFRRCDAVATWRAILEVFQKSLLEGNSLDLRGFGLFYIGERKAQRVSTVFTKDMPGGTKDVAERKTIRFVPSKIVKRLINKKELDQE